MSGYNKYGSRLGNFFSSFNEALLCSCFSTLCSLASRDPRIRTGIFLTEDVAFFTLSCCFALVILKTLLSSSLLKSLQLNKMGR